MKTRRLFFLFISLLSVCNVCGQSKNEFIHKIDSLVQVKNPRPFNGVILITRKGKNIYSKAYGFANSKTQVPLTLDNQFGIMSNTKQITAVLILKEVEKGHINLQAPIKQYIPSLTRSWADTVTVHQLLNHTHGITDIKEPLAFKPGTDFKYGNLSNILLGQIIENVSHKTYRELADSLFRSLKMKHTFCYSKTDKKELVNGHVNENNNFTTLDSMFIPDHFLPANGVITTAEDLSLWNDKLHNGSILKHETYKLMTTPSALSQHDVFGAEKTGYGYGIRIVEDNGIKYLGHTGLGAGFASLNIYIPDSDLSLIVLENQMAEGLYYLFEIEIKNLVLKSDL